MTSENVLETLPIAENNEQPELTAAIANAIATRTVFDIDKVPSKANADKQTHGCLETRGSAYHATALEVERCGYGQAVGVGGDVMSMRA